MKVPSSREQGRMRIFSWHKRESVSSSGCSQQPPTLKNPSSSLYYYSILTRKRDGGKGGGENMCEQGGIGVGVKVPRFVF